MNQKVKFGEICKNISDRINDPSLAETDCYVGLEHLESDEPKIMNHGIPEDVEATKLKFKPNQILFGKRRWYQRKLAVTEQREGICSAHMLVLEAIEGKIIKEFLPYFMQTDQFFEQGLMISEGSLSPTIKWRNLEKLKFLIPSIPKQKTIIKIMQQTDDHILKTQNLLEKTHKYLQARQEEIFSNMLVD